MAAQWNELGAQEKAVWEEKAKTDKEREIQEIDEWESFIEEWILSMSAKQTESRANKRIMRTDDVLAQRKEEARVAKKKRMEEDKEKKRMQSEAKKNGTANSKMTTQQLQNRKMKDAYENSVKRRASFYSEVGPCTRARVLRMAKRGGGARNEVSLD